MYFDLMQPATNSMFGFVPPLIKKISITPYFMFLGQSVQCQWPENSQIEQSCTLVYTSGAQF